MREENNAPVVVGKEVTFLVSQDRGFLLKPVVWTTILFCLANILSYFPS